MLQDLRFAFRLLGKDRRFTVFAITALALGIGVNATVFTLVNAALIRGLPFEESDRLQVLTWRARTGARLNLSHIELQDWRTQAPAFTALAAYRSGTMNVSGDGALPEQARGAWLSANAFAVLRQQPLIGRGFAPADDAKGAAPVAIVGYTLWKNRYGGDPQVLGKSLRVNGQAATIVGVMPNDMRFPSNTQLWLPFVPTEEQDRRDARVLTVFGRLQNGVDPDRAQAELNGLARQFAAAYPDTNKDLTSVRVESFTDRFVGGRGRTVFIVIMGAVCFVLLIACANVANLLLSRSAARARELAVRIALGATRWRVARQLLIESIVLGLIGGSIGLLLAVVGTQIIDAAIQDPDKPYWIVFTVDYVVIGYVAAICVLTAMLFSLAPILQLSTSNIGGVLKDGGRGTAGNRRVGRLHGPMVVVELMLTVVLLAGAGLMIRSFVKLYTLDIGIRTDHLMTMRLQLPEEKYATPEARLAFYQRLEPQLAAIPGLEGGAVTTSVPPFDADERMFEIDGRPPRAEGERAPFVSTVAVSPRFFEVVRVALLRGRSFQETDGSPGFAHVIVNARLATQFFQGEDPIGRRIRFVTRAPTPEQTPPVWYTIVGISPTIRHGSMQDDLPEPVVYLPHRQDLPLSASLLVRSQLPPGSVMDAVRRAVRAIDEDQPVFTMQTLDQMLAQRRWPFRVFGGLFVIFAVIALVLSSVGLYAVMEYAVTQRTQEIGVRMALGADRRQMSWLILKRGLVQLAIGLSLGLLGAFLLTRVLRGVLVQIAPTDPLTFGVITILLILVSIAACLLPVRRATRIDPLVALRAE